MWMLSGAEVRWQVEVGEGEAQMLCVVYGPTALHEIARAEQGRLQRQWNGFLRSILLHAYCFIPPWLSFFIRVSLHPSRSIVSPPLFFCLSKWTAGQRDLISGGYANDHYFGLQPHHPQSRLAAVEGSSQSRITLDTDGWMGHIMGGWNNWRVADYFHQNLILV